ncbi:cation transporter, partial [bacterium]|nr:cation transporter [bacterium]
VSRIENIHHIHLWQLNDTDIFLEAHVDFKEDLRLSQVCQKLALIRKLLKDSFNINHVTLQPEFGVTDEKKMIVNDRS